MRPFALLFALSCLVAAGCSAGDGDDAPNGAAAGPAAEADVARATELVDTALAARAAKRYAEARDLFREAAGLDPDNPVAQRGAAMRIPSAADVQRAQRALENATRYRRLGEAMKTYRALGEAYRLDPNDHAIRYGFANAAATVRRYHEALPIFDELIEEEPGSAKYRISAAYFAYDFGNYEKAFAYVEDFTVIEEAAKTDAEVAARLPHVLFMRGLAASELQRAGEEMESFRRAVEMAPDEIKFRHHYGGVLLEEGRFEEAEKQFREVLARAPDDINDRVNLARALEKEGRYDEAAREYEIALKADPSRWLQMVFAARTYEAMGTEAGLLRALSWLDRAIEKNPQSREAYFTLARVHRRLGNVEAADRYQRTYDRIRKLVDDNEAELRSLIVRLRDDPRDIDARLRMIAIHDEYHHLEDVVTECKALLAIEPMHPEALYHLALAFMIEGNVDAMYYEAQKLIDAAPADDRGYHLSALALIQRNRPQEALDVARLGYEVNPRSFASLESMLRAMQLLGGYDSEMARLLPEYERLKRIEVQKLDALKARDKARADELLEALR